MTCYTALITPFDDQGRLDEEGFANILSLQAPVDGLVVLGTTGETPTLSLDEKKRILALARKSPLPLMAGCGAYSTTQTLENLHLAAEFGADSALVVTPYYNKPTQEGLFRHFENLATHSPLPIVIYNIQGRTSVNLKVETLKRLLSFPNILGIKEASGNLSQICEIVSMKKIRPDFKVFAGDDVWTLPLMALGGDGVISVSSNLAPRLMKELVDACMKGEWGCARAINQRLLPLYEASGFETNPIPIKAAMQAAGLPGGAPRLPLTPLDETYLPMVKRIVKDLI
ncbi:MAG: 4-hydroxy-tetrahydrodipicolinate synthase [Chlamydiales bacterium]|nr:4-hydroxy-tetrahydrodipicolinate synthase [Chlamydiales bacterium]